ncbi:MAG: PIN domain-containing protein [Planctomycetota bacterium]|nr:PIN domain-containing protein [Planctomycetota bacterium]
MSLDTAPLVYFIGKNPAFHTRLRPFFQALQQGDFTVVISAITITEVLVYPIRHGDAKLALLYRDILLNAEHMRIIPVTGEIAEMASKLRASHKILTPDAIQLATASVMQVDFFLTNNKALPVLPKPTILVLDNLLD